MNVIDELRQATGYDPDREGSVDELIAYKDALEDELARRQHPSDTYHPVLGFDGDAHDTLDGVIRSFRGYGVTLTLEDGSEVEAVLSQPIYDEDSDRLLIEFLRVTDGEYEVIDCVEQKKLERAFVSRIQVG